MFIRSYYLEAMFTLCTAFLKISL